MVLGANIPRCSLGTLSTRPAMIFISFLLSHGFPPSGSAFVRRTLVSLCLVKFLRLKTVGAGDDGFEDVAGGACILAVGVDLVADLSVGVDLVFSVVFDGDGLVHGALEDRESFEDEPFVAGFFNLSMELCTPDESSCSGALFGLVEELRLEKTGMLELMFPDSI